MERAAGTSTLILSIYAALLSSAETQGNAAQSGGAQPGDVVSDGVVSAIETEEQEVGLYKHPEVHHPSHQNLSHLPRPPSKSLPPVCRS